MADYDPQALKDGIDKCKVNIKTFEQAIEDERQTIVSYRQMIDHLQLKKQLADGVEIDAEDVRKNGSTQVAGVVVDADPDD